MTFSVIEWFVLVFAVIGLIKLLFIGLHPKSWFNFSKKIYSSPMILFIVELILAAVLFYYLLMELGIVMLMAGVVLGALLTGMTVTIYAKEILELTTKIYKGNVLKKLWFPLLIWVVLLVWVLVELF